MAATERFGSLAAHAWRVLASLAGGLLASGGARAVDLPADRAEALFHVYDGGGVRATGPALLVRKKLADKVSVSGSYYVDMVSNASVDVVTTASPFKEKRDAFDVGVDYVVRDATLKFSASSSQEPDYTARSWGLDVSQEVFGGMTTVNLGYTRGSDRVGKHLEPNFAERATHWQYRVGVTQVLTPRWIASANFEAVSDDGYLGSPYRVARFFGVPSRHENVPGTRSSRAIKLRAIGDLGARDAVRGEYRYFWDNWAIKAHTLEAGYSRYIGELWLADATARFHKQGAALFYSDNFTTTPTYFSTNRQLSAFDSFGLGLKLSYLLKRVEGGHEVKAHGAYERIRFQYGDFTDARTGRDYSFDANLLQLYLTASF